MASFSRLLVAAPISLLLVVGCSSREAPSTTTSSATATSSPSRAAPLDVIAAHSVFAAHLGKGETLVAETSGLAVASSTDAWSSHLRLAVRLPNRLADATHVAVAGDDSVSIDLAPLDLDAGAASSIHDGALVFHDAARDLDVVHVAEPDRVEEYRVLSSAAAPSTARYAIHLGKGLASIRVVDHRVEALDATGAIRIATTDAFALDAHGVHRDLDLRLEGDHTLVVSLATDGLAYPIVVDPAWVATVSPMTLARTDHAAARLGNGKVLIVGGYPSGSTAELYDPATGKFTATAAPKYSNTEDGAAVTLASGLVLHAGGNTTSSAETFDGTTNTFTSVASMTTARLAFTLTLLSNGTVLAVGGGSEGTSSITSTAELYNPTTNTWTAAGTMASQRCYHNATLLGNGKVLVVGGTSPSTYLSTTELWDPTTKTFSAGPTLSGQGIHPTSTLLSNGKVLIVFDTTAQLYDPTTNTLTTTAPPSKSRRYSSSVELPNGKALVIAGIFDAQSAEVFDPATNTWSSTPAMLYPHAERQTATLLASGGVLVAGGGDTGFVQTSTAEIFTPGANGVACATSAECNGFCVDGVCCNSPCTGSCQACNVTGSVGTCTNVTGAPHGSRTCAPYATCNAGSCATTCSVDGDCVAGDYCTGGKCVGKKSNGTACAAANECSSNECVDGVCCNSACGGQCQACDVAGSVGVCTIVSGNPHGARPACNGTGLGTTCGESCRGSTSCTYAPTSTICSTNSCSGGVETHANTCDGAGKCSDTPKTCGAYACGSTLCNTTCTASADCASGFYCKAGACIPVEGLGTDCANASTCTTGFCTDGVCCGVASCGAGSSCANAGAKGQCTKDLGSACSADGECGSGHCADGVCCDSACGDQCAACDVAGSVGTCTAVQGKPHGTRTACDDGGSSTCAARVCDGVPEHTSSCAGYANGTNVSCGSPSCQGSSFTGAAACDGAGACKTPVATSCVPFACDSTGCLTSCTDATQCASGFGCTAGKCVAVAATCSSDGLSSIPKGGSPVSCEPYRCGADGACAQTCTTSDECAPGATCDDSSHACVSGAGGSSSSGGCSVGARGTAFGAFALLGVVSFFLARRRRAV